MITGEATYSKVAEAAESALDGYLLKPHKPSQLLERLQQARQRKVALQSIFTASEANDFAGAAKQCVERFEARSPFWLYAARIGAELLLRIDQPVIAKKLYEAVIKAKTLPWAKLGVARSMLDSGQVTAAVSTLENLLAEDPKFADAYDVMGRAQFELGKFEDALATYRMAYSLTPASIGRLQSLGIMSYYAGHHEEAERALQRTCAMGLESKMFDYQSLVLMAFVQCERGDKKALHRCVQDLDRVIEKKPDALRPRRLAKVVHTLSLLMNHQMAHALESVRELMHEVRKPEFDFESASNLVSLLALMAKRSIQLDEVEKVMEQLALRFCASRSLTELLAGAALAHPPYAEAVRAGNAQVIRYAEYAMSLSLRGNPGGAVLELIARGGETLNAKLVDSAEQVLARYSEKIGETSDLHAQVQTLRGLCMVRPAPGAADEGPRKAGALSLRVGAGSLIKKVSAA
jgi:cytochrome c-type biogenesis protein CcmH/NrfG